MSNSESSILFIESLLNQPGDDREVAPFIVGWQDDRVLILGGIHFGIELIQNSINVSRTKAIKSKREKGTSSLPNGV